MAGEDMLSFIELSRTAVERHPPLLDWVRSWTERPSLEPLTPEGWFEEGHGITGGAPDRNNVWIPTHGRAGQLFLWIVDGMNCWRSQEVSRGRDEQLNTE